MGNRVVFNKLVRDRIPEIIRTNGNECGTKILSDKDYIQALRDKLIEEANEVAEAHDDNLVKELADLYEVIEALMKTSAIKQGEIIEKQKQQKAERGAFEDKIYLVWVE